MVNRIEKGLDAWHRQEAQFAGIFGKHALQGRAFAKIRLAEMQKLYRRCQPPRNLYERVSVKMLLSANKSLERQLYPGRISRVGRRLIKAAGNFITQTTKWILGNPVAERDRAYLATRMPTPKQSGTDLKAAKTLTKPKVVRLRPRQHEALDLGEKQSKGIRR